MFDLIRKTVLTGIGLAVMTKDKVEDLARLMIDKGEMSEKEGKELIDELLKKSEEARKDFETKVEEIIHKVLKKADVATREDLEEMEKKIKALEQRISRDTKDGN